MATEFRTSRSFFTYVFGAEEVAEANAGRKKLELFPDSLYSLQHIPVYSAEAAAESALFEYYRSSARPSR